MGNSVGEDKFETNLGGRKQSLPSPGKGREFSDNTEEGEA
jgi:hypothetical protein